MPAPHLFLGGTTSESPISLGRPWTAIPSPKNRIRGVPSHKVSPRIDPDVARQIIEALSRVEAAEAGRQFIYTVTTESQAPGVGTGEHAGLLRTYANDGVTIGTNAGDVEIGWYEITSIGVAPD